MSLTKHLGKKLQLLLRPRSLAVHLAPQQLLCVLREGRQTVAGSARHIAINAAGGHWQAGVDALRQLLQQNAGEWHGVPLEISLSGRWSQLALAPWSDALLSEPAATRFLQLQLAALYGEAAQSWHIVGDDAPYGHARAVCGVDGTLLQALRELAAECGHTWHAIEPAISAALRWLPQAATSPTTARPDALALVEPDRITLAALHGGRLTALQSQPAGPRWTQELPQAWQRWTLRLPELSGIENVAVIDLTSVGLTAGLPPPFQLVDSPFGALPVHQQEQAA